MIGITYRPELDPWLDRRPTHLGCIEIQAERFYSLSRHRLQWLAARYPLIVRCSSLSLGGPDPIHDRRLDAFANFVCDAEPLWVAVPLGFDHAGGIDLGMTVPMPFTTDTLAWVADRIAAVMARCQRPLIVENIASPLRIPGTIAETEFLNRLCEQTGCGMLVDLANLLLDGQRHRFSAVEWIRDLDATRIKELRIPAPVEQEFDGQAVFNALPRPPAVVFALTEPQPVHRIEMALSAAASPS